MVAMAKAIEEAVGIGQWVVAMEATAEMAAQVVARVAVEVGAATVIEIAA